MHVETIDIGDRVQCDGCGKIWTRDMPGEGGILCGSYARCPDCGPAFLEDLKKYGELNHLTATQPAGVTFWQWCMDLRGGNNVVTTTSFDTTEELVAFLSKR